MAAETPGPAAVSLSELLNAFEFVSASPFDEYQAYICRITGRIIFVSEDIDPEEEELPDDVAISDQYHAVPNRRDLHLGAKLALSFVSDELPTSLREARDIFSRRGAYRRFKQMLEDTRSLDKWYAFEADAVATALKDWCAEVGLSLIDE